MGSFFNKKKGSGPGLILAINLRSSGFSFTIFKIAEGRYNLGKIAENELLQLELNLMNSRQSSTFIFTRKSNSVIKNKTSIR